MDKDYLMLGRRVGKGYLAKLAVERALDEGKKVFVCNTNGMTMQKRKKHLTLIENISTPAATKVSLLDLDQYWY